jgi:hypothetical protein
VPLHLTTSWVDKDYDWGRPDGRPFSPEHLTLEEWLVLYRELPLPVREGRDYMRVALPTKMSLHRYTEEQTETVTHMSVVAFRKLGYYGCSHEGMQGYVWHPEGASQEVLEFLRTAGVMNPLGSKY